MATASSTLMEMAWQPRDREAQLLAAMLRSSRLTLLCGDAGVGKSRLLRDGVLPRLRRRASDRVAAVGPVAVDRSATAVPAADRRRRGSGTLASGAREVAIYINAWGDAPLAQLRNSLRAAMGKAGVAVATHTAWPENSLCDEIAALSLVQNARLLFVLDGFERYLRESPDADGSREFANEWVRVLNEPTLAANFLIAMRHDARPLLERFHRDLPALERNWLSLPALPALRDRPAPQAAPAPKAAPAAPRVPLLAIVPPARPLAARQATPEPDIAPIKPPVPTPQELSPQAALPAPASSPASSPSPSTARRAWVRKPSAAAGALGTLTTLALIVALWPTGSEPEAPAAAVIAQAPLQPGVPTPQPLPPPAWPVQTGAEQRSDAQVAIELMRSVSATALPGTQPALRIAHYDALQATRATPTSPPLRIVAPLFPEELHLIVRADSPLTAIHQIRDSRINIGPITGDEGPGTAAVLYQRLFGTALPAAQTRTEAWPAALAALKAGRTDVLVMVDAQPSAWLSELSPADRRAIKLLALDPAAPQSREALKSFLPAALRPPGELGSAAGAAGTAVPTLAVMSFLTTPGPAVDNDAALVTLAQAWCRALPELRRSGHPKWREVQPALELPVGWPSVASIREALSACALPSSTPSPTPPPTQSPSPSPTPKEN